MAIENLNSVLRGIVASCPTKGVNNNYLVDQKGKVIKITGKDVHLWNDEMYHTPADQFFCFQPFNELVTHEESPALGYLRKMLNTELNTVLMQAIPAVLNAAVSIKVPNKRQLAIFGETLGEVPKSTVEFLTSLLKATKLSHRTRSIVDISLYNTHPITREADGHKYAAIKSPLLNDLAFWTAGDKIFEIPKPPTKTAVEIIRHVLRALLPADWEGGMYFVGNRHTNIPHNKALHDLYSDVLERIADVMDTLKIKDVTVPAVHEDWTNGLLSITKLMQGIPRDVYGTIGAVRAGVDPSAVKEETRMQITEGFGANAGVTTTTTTTVQPGGLLGAMSQAQNAPGLNPALMAVPQGYVLMPVGNTSGLLAGPHGQSLGQGMPGQPLQQGGLLAALGATNK